MILRLLASLLAIAGLVPLASATPSFNSATPWNAVVTFQSIGLYWKPSGVSGGKAAVRFRPQGTSTWREGHELWWDARNAEFRGSLVELDQNTVYEIQLKVEGINHVGPGAWTNTSASCNTASAQECSLPPTSTCNSANRNQCTRTWSDNYPVKERRTVTAGMLNQQGQLVITEGGNENEGYIVYEGPFTIALAEGSGECVVVDAKFVVVRNLVLQGCGSHGIRLHSVHVVGGSTGPRRAASDIIIEDNEITRWGRFDPNPDDHNPPRPLVGRPLALDGDAAIFCNNRAETANGDDDVNNRTHRIVVQRNNIHSPRYSAEAWHRQESETRTHPLGAIALNFTSCGWNHVVRWNDVYSTPNAQGQINHFKDGFQGSPDLGLSDEDSGAGGFPWADTDIYGNRITHIYDDGIEAEGQNRNVRIWANYFDRIFQAVGSAATAVGPFYVWRNVTNWMANMGCTQCDPDTTLIRNGLIKGGGRVASFSGGIAYYYHNTLLQPPPTGVGVQLPMGANRAISSIGELFYNFVSRNNILHTHRVDNFRTINADCHERPCTPPTPDDGPSADYDLFNGRLLNAGPGAEANAVALGWGNASSGDPSAIPTYANPGARPWYPAVIPSQSNGWTGDFRLAADSKGVSNLLPLLPNFNDLDSARHVGAQPPNKSEMKFGRAAATSSGGGGTPPQAALNTTPSPASGPAPLTVTFDASGSVDGSSPITSLRLQFGHGSPPQEVTWTDKNQIQQYTYPAGQYTATLTVTTAHGQDDAQVPVTVTNSCSAPPTASFTATPQSGPAPLAVAFNASASSAVSPAMITAYNITYGDGGSGTGVTQSHTYTSAGNYIATLIVTDSNGCQSSPATQQVVVTSPGQPTFRSAASASYGPSILFRAASSAATNGSSLTTNRPTGTAANDVMIASIGVRPATVTIGVPAGWTLVRRIDNGTNISLAVFRKVAGSGEPSSYTWDVPGATYAVGGIKSFANVDTANPIDVENGQATPTALTHTAPSVTTTVANAMVVTAHTFATSTTWTPPSGMTEAFDAQFQPVAANFGQSMEGNYVLQAAAGATGAKTATAAGSSGAEGAGATHILVLRPTTALNIAKPAGTAANDVMIASIGVRPPSTVVTAPAGWTLVNRIDNGTQVSLAVYRKAAGSSEPSSFGWNVSGATYAVGGIQSFANVDTANPIDVENGQATATALTHTAPSVTTTVANAMLVTSHTFATSTTWTPPSGMTEAFDAQVQPVAVNLGQSIEGNYVLQPSAGASGAKTATAAGSAGAEGAGATHTLALRPSSGAPPAGGDTVTLMQGLNDYDGTTDTWIRASASTSNFGSQCCFDVLEENSASGLVRFNIFASEGGPVPDGATIISATLSFYKYAGPQATLKVSRLLKSWTELGATWNVTGSGSNWTSAGANSAGNDYLATPDAQASAAEAPGCNTQDGGAVCWVHFDVTTGVQAFKSGTTNHGWKLAYLSGSPDPTQAKRFNQRNNPNWPSLRPKLTIIYSTP